MNRNTLSDQTFGPARAAPRPGMAQASRSANGSASGSGAQAAAAATAPFLLGLFIFSILPPIYFNLGETRLSPTRIVLLALFVPLAFRLFSGAAGRIRAIDILMFLFSGWMVIVLLYHDGMARLPFAGISVIEILGGYLVGRTLVCNATDYQTFVRYMLWALLILLPFSLIEFVWNVNLLKELFGTVFETFRKPLSQSFRMGFARVSSGFEHPILYGLFCAMTIAPIFYLHKRSLARSIFYAALGFGMTVMSLSSAPLIAAMICVMLIIWDYATGGRWKLLLWVSVSMFIFLSIASNRGPLVIMIDYLTFNAHTAWTRIWTFHYGSIQVMKHPVLGMGLFEHWPRPSGLTPSVDNFWLLIAMRYGFPGIILLALALASGLRSVIKAKNLEAAHAGWRTGYVIALIGLYFTLTTVHIWGDTSSFLMCFVGAGIWFSASGISAPAAQSPLSERSRPGAAFATSHSVSTAVPKGSARGLPTTRFAHTHDRRTR